MGDSVVTESKQGMALESWSASFAQEIHKPQTLATMPAAASEDQTKKSYLNRGVNSVTSLFISNENLRGEVNHYSCEFLKTASLFATGKIGIGGSLLVYGLDQASPDSKPLEQVEDFALGAAKGGSLKGLYSVLGRNIQSAPAKGVVLGMAASAAEIGFSRQAFSNPSAAFSRFRSEALNPQTMLVNGALFMAGEGLFGAANSASGGALARSRLASGMVMGGSFGMVNGATSEIVRQQAAGEKIDLGKVLTRGALEGGVSALGAGAGMKVSDPAFHASARETLSSLKEHTLNRWLNGDATVREFAITGGQQALDAFRQRQSPSAELLVREMRRGSGKEELGPVKRLFVQHLGEGENTLLPQALRADLIATCHPENLAFLERTAHAFPEGKGPVWLELSRKGDLRLSVGDAAERIRQRQPLATLIKLDHSRTTFNVMAPLVVGDPGDPGGAASKPAWDDFQSQLARAKQLGVDGVTTDVWWGLVEPKPGQFQWSYYDQLSNRVTGSGLKWVPILSFHQAGGNIGDNVNIPLPKWLWSDLSARVPSGKAEAVKYVSEQGNASSEYISAWATELALPEYKRVMSSFQEHFAGKAPSIAEINISLGPAGELRYPSYNSHDTGTGYPTRGALQSYSELARESFRQFALTKYGSESGVAKAWKLPSGQAVDIEPPGDANAFFGRGDHFNTQYGRDFMDWYSDSLISHGRTLLTAAHSVFNAENAPFAGIDLGAKIPGVHWRVGTVEGNRIVLGDRMAELTAGLIRTSRGDWDTDEAGRGYRPLLSLFKELQPLGVVPHFTALEMPDGQDGPAARSLPHSLALWVGQEAQRQGLTIKGENALNGTIPDANSWDRMRSLLILPGQDGYYRGLTILRMSDILASDTARAKAAEIIRMIASAKPPARKAA